MRCRAARQQCRTGLQTCPERTDVAWQIVSGTHPGRLLLLTFTRGASAEILQRVAQIRGAAWGDRVLVAAWGHSFIERHWRHMYVKTLYPR